MGNNTSLYWDIVFRCHLTDKEIMDLEKLKSLLSLIHLTLLVPNAKAWISFLGILLVKYIFSTLSIVSNFVPFYRTNFLWKSKVPSKARALARLVAHKKVNIVDML